MEYKQFYDKYVVKGKFSSEELWFCRVKELIGLLPRMDFDVYLPTKSMNLQRPYVWNNIQEKELIMSILLDKKIPPIKYLSIDSGKRLDDYQIIDGKQRLTAIIKFLQDKFKVEIEGKEYLFSELSESFKHQINNYVISGQACYEDFKGEELVKFTDEFKIKWFCLINFSSTPQEETHKVKLLNN